MYKTRSNRSNCSTKIQTLNTLPCKVSILNNAKHIVQIHSIALLKSCEAVPVRYFAKTKLLILHCCIKFMGKSFEVYIKAFLDCLKKLEEEAFVKNVTYCF